MTRTFDQEERSKIREGLRAEEAKSREQSRDLRKEMAVLAIRTYADQTHALRLSALSNVKEYGLQTVRYLFLLNGGAILALLTFLGSVFAKSDEKNILIAISFAHQIKYGLYCFTAGLVFAGLTSAATYRNWLSVVETYQDPFLIYKLIAEGTAEDPPEIHGKEVTRYAVATVTAGWTSLACFVGGILFVAQAFGVFGA